MCRRILYQKLRANIDCCRKYTLKRPYEEENNSLTWLGNSQEEAISDNKHPFKVEAVAK